MKKILYGIFAFFIASNFTFGQTLMSDEDHRIMMNTYATNLNNILTANCPQGITIDQFKKNIVNGQTTLSSAVQTSITNAASPLITYGGQFITAKNFTGSSDAYKYFYSTFAPSTAMQNDSLIENTTTAGLTGVDMWECALSFFNTGGCNNVALVENRTYMPFFANAATTFLTNRAGNTGILVMIGGFSDCLDHKNQLEQTGFAMSRNYTYVDLIENINAFKNQHVVNQGSVDQLIAQDTLTTADMESLAVNLGFQNKAALDNFHCTVKSHIDFLNTNFLNPNGTMRMATGPMRPGDNLTLITAADRYYQGTKLNLTRQLALNIGIIDIIGSCGNIGARNRSVCENGIAQDHIDRCYRNYQIEELGCKWEAVSGVKDTVYLFTFDSNAIIDSLTWIGVSVYGYGECRDFVRGRYCNCLKN